MRRLIPYLLCATTSVAAGARVVTLEEAYDRVAESDQSVRIAWLAARKADYEPASALTRMGPQLIGTVSGDRLHRSVSSGTPASTLNSRTGTGQVGLTLDQPLLDMTVFPAYRRGKLVSKATQLQYQSLVRQVLLSVTSAYYAVLQQEQIVVVDQQAVELAKENVEVAEKRAKAGEVTRTDTLRATAQYQENKRTLIESTSTLDLRRNTLANLLNMDPAQGVEVREPGTTTASIPSFASLLGTAYAKREDLQAQELTIHQDEERRKEIRAQYAPKISAQISALSNSTSNTTANDADTHSWQAGISMSLPFMTGGQREIDLKTSAIQIEQTKLDYDKLRKSIQEEVKTAWVDVQTLKETIVALKAEVEAAERGYEDLQSQYKAGTAKSIDVLDALKTLNSARKDLAVQSYGYQVALRKLEQVSGVFQERRVKKATTP
jgi:outer membrane protein TolC